MAHIYFVYLLFKLLNSILKSCKYRIFQNLASNVIYFSTVIITDITKHSKTINIFKTTSAREVFQNLGDLIC